MTEPTKFNLGGVPRTRTGLVPASFKQTADKLSTPEKWEALPKQPPPTLYPFRGDYVNEKNKKIARERMLAQKKQKQRLFDSSRKSESDSSFGASLLVTPPRSLKSSSISSTGETSTASPAPDNTQTWDSYCKHTNCHRLSEDEERTRTQNRDKALSYLRSEASKRHNRNGRKKQEDKENRQNEEQPVVRQRKPPVPRLSRLARSGKKKETRRSNQSSNATKDKDSGSSKPVESKDTTEQAPTSMGNAQEKVRYLDFISKKLEESPDSNPAKEDETASDGDDESQFRIQIERIVERAAELVLAEQRMDPEGPSEKATDDSESPRNESVDTSSPQSGPNKGTDDSNTITSSSTHREEILQRQSVLSFLEEKVRNMSSSESKDSDTGSLGTSTMLGYLESFQPGKSHCLPESVDNARSLVGDSLSEVNPRAQMQPQPMNFPPRRHQCFGDKSMSDLLRGLELSSCATDSTQDVPGKQAPSAVSGTHHSLDSTDASCKVEPDAAMPRTTHSNRPLEVPSRLESCPEEALPPPVQPTLEPSRIQWEDEPRPRGYDQPAQVSIGRDTRSLNRWELEDEPLPRGFEQSQLTQAHAEKTIAGSSVADYLFELL